MKRILDRGFTLSELMVASSIVAILAAVSVSLYRTQLIKQQAAEGTAFAQYVQAPVIGFTIEEGRFPTTAELYTDLHLTDSPEGQLSRFKYIDYLLSEIKETREGVSGALYVVFSKEASSDLENKVIKLEYDSAQTEEWACNTDLSQAPLEKCIVVKKISLPASAGPNAPKRPGPGPSPGGGPTPRGGPSPTP